MACRAFGLLIPFPVPTFVDPAEFRRGEEVLCLFPFILAIFPWSCLKLQLYPREHWPVDVHQMQSPCFSFGFSFPLLGQRMLPQLQWLSRPIDHEMRHVSLVSFGPVAIDHPFSTFYSLFVFF